MLGIIEHRIDLLHTEIAVDPLLQVLNEGRPPKAMIGEKIYVILDDSMLPDEHPRRQS